VDLYDYGFVLLNRASFLNKPEAQILEQRSGIDSKNIGAFESWARQLYDIGQARWFALDMESKLIAFGNQIPDSKDFEQLLRQKGYKTPLRMVRDYLRENPDHLDAKTDLLTEARRRALLHEPITASEDLTTEQDMKKWGPLAIETDNVFRGSWLGIELDFFRPEDEQPERFSPMMRAAFKKHIGSVESAIRLQPTNRPLWKIWAWMARSIPDYKWKNFVDTLEPVIFYSEADSPTSCPSAEVSVWLVDEAKAKGDWETVIKYAKQARGFVTRSNREYAVEWMPGGSATNAYISSIAVEGYPGKSYASHLEALLRLGRVDDANNLYDEMMRLEGRTGSQSFRTPTNNALLAANAARAAGMEEAAKIWEQGEQINEVPYLTYPFYIGAPKFYLLASYGSKYQAEFEKLTDRLDAGLHTAFSSPRLNETLGLKEEDGNRWALVGADGRLLHQDTDIPDLDGLKRILVRYGVEGYIKQYREYLARNGSVPGVELLLGIRNISSLRDILGTDQPPLSDYQIEALWSETTRILRGLVLGHPDVFTTYPYAPSSYDAFKGNESMQNLSKLYMTAIESLLEKKPSYDALWRHWFFWRGIEDKDRSVEPLMERIKTSPLTKPGTVPSIFVINSYYEECKKNGKWPKVIGLLKPVWDREFFKVAKAENETADRKLPNPKLGDNVGIPLIEAYLHDGKPNEASDIFNAWLACGGTFANFAKVIELAISLGYEMLGRRWENRLKK
jgi:hypothetical protein